MSDNNLRDDLLAEEYECLLTIWALEDKVELVETSTEVELHYRPDLFQELFDTWEGLESRQKIAIATLVCLHYGIALLPENLATMKMNYFNSSPEELRVIHEENPVSLTAPTARKPQCDAITVPKLFVGE